MALGAHVPAVTTALVAVGTVHESAAVCDHLADRDDVERVVGVGVPADSDPPARRDAGEALNVLGVRLPDHEVATDLREGDPAVVVPLAVEEHDADEVLVAPGFASHDAVADALDRPLRVVEDPDAA